MIWRARAPQVVMEPREIVVHRLELVSSEPDMAIFEAECGKGTYVRAIARDLGRLLGCYGHVVLLRRTRVGPFLSERSVTLEALRDGAGFHAAGDGAAGGGPRRIDLHSRRPRRRRHPAARAKTAAARRPRAGRRACLCRRVSASPIAFGVVEAGYFVSTRVFNLAG